MAKQSKVLSHYPKKKFLKLLSVRKECPLTFEDRLVFSALVYLSIKKVKCTRRKLARRLCLDKGTVSRSINRLATKRLVDPSTLTALQPDQTSEDWFVRISRPTNRWQEQMAYLSVPIPRVMPPKVTWRTLLVHSFLLSKATAEGKTRICASEIARILRLDPRTVRKSLVILEDKLLIEVDERHKLIRSNYLDATWLEHFQDQRKEPPSVLGFSEDRPWEDMTEKEIHAHVFDPAISRMVQLLRHMRYYGHYSSLNLDTVRSWIRRYLLDEGKLTALYNAAVESHAASQEKGSYLNQTSFSLLQYRIHEKYGKDVG